MVGKRSQSVTIPSNTSTLLLQQSVRHLLKDHQPNDVVINMNLSTTTGVSYQNNIFLCQQKDLQLQPDKPSIQVEQAEGGCRITLKANKFIRALALSIDDEDYWLDNNYFDLLPGKSTTCFLQTRLSAEEVKQKLSIRSLF